jgi:hypothetical protein
MKAAGQGLLILLAVMVALRELKPEVTFTFSSLRALL